MMRKLFFHFFLLFLGIYFSRTCLAEDYLIARNPAWFPIQFEYLTPQINIFTDTLIDEIADANDISLKIVNVDWIQLLQGLEEEKFEGALTALEPNLITQTKYTFSKPFLRTGPVLIVPSGSKIKSLSQINEGIIGISQYDNSVLIVQQYPSLIIKSYEMMPNALDDLSKGKLDAVLFETLKAHSLIPLRYPKLKIVSPPLNEEGLRLITLKGQNQGLIDDFNDGLAQMKRSGKYRKFRKRFSLK